jgi:hypothetical protein
MDPFLKMDVFFVVATLGVVVVSGFAAFALWRLERVLKNVEHISAQVAAESDNVRLDLAEMRADIRRGKGRVKSLLDFFGKTVKRNKEKS